MKRSMPAWLFSLSFIVISVIVVHSSFAGGLYVSQVNSPVSVGTAGVNNVVNTLGADAAYTNPAGMTGIKRDTIMPGFQIMIPEARFDASIAEAGGDDGGNAGEVAAIPGFSAVKILSDSWRLGFAITAPLGGGVNYGNNFVGRYQATKSSIAGLGITPSLGYKINDRVSVGLGITAIYTDMDLEMAINQSRFGLSDGELRMNNMDDWGAQGVLGLTWRVTDRALLGFVYRTKSEAEVEGDVDFRDIQIPIINRITSRIDTVEIDFDYPQVFAVGLAYDVSDNLRVVADLDYEEWSEFSDNYISIQSGAITTAIDRNWDDTWHVGLGALYKLDDSFVTAGIAYDSSPVDDEDRTFDIPVDEQVKVGVSYGRHVRENLTYALGLSYMWLGDGKIDQTTQNVRVKGEFDTNYVVSIGGNMRYMF